jgi:hypothetical protein
MMLKVIAAFFLAALSSSASTVIVYVGSVGPYGPVNLLVDQVNAVGVCINRDVPITETWQADLLTLNDIPVSDQKTYLEAAWLNQQFGLSTDWEGIHEGIWNLFGSYRPEGTPWVALAEANYATVDPASFYILVATPLRSVQTFIVALPDEESPEPATYATMLIGLVLGCALHVRILSSRRGRCQIDNPDGRRWL